MSAEQSTSAHAKPTLPVRVLAELVGTFMVCFVTYAVTTYVLTLTGNTNNILLVALTIAATYALATLLFARYSGAQFNPAVTLASLFIGRTHWLDALLYVIAQVVGAIAAGAAVIKFLPVSEQLKLSMWLSASGYSSSVNGFGTASPSTVMLQGSGAEFSQTSAIIIELVITLLVVATVIATMSPADGKSNGNRQAIASALAYGIATLIAFPITGASINPVRATGIALFAQGQSLAVEPLSQIWLFWVCALLAGAIVALCIIIVRVLAAQSNKPKKAKSPAVVEQEDTDTSADDETAQQTESSDAEDTATPTSTTDEQSVASEETSEATDEASAQNTAEDTAVTSEDAAVEEANTQETK